MEFQCHGGAVTAQEVLAAVLRAGRAPGRAREVHQARVPRRAHRFAQAESVMDLISARTARAAHASLQQMDGYLSRRIHALQDKLLDTIAYLEATLDYPDEDIEPLTARRAAEEARAVQTALQEAVRNARARAPAERRRADRPGRQPEHRQILPAQLPAARAARHCDGCGGNDAGRAPRGARPLRPARAALGHRGPAQRGGRGGAHRHRPRAGGAAPRGRRALVLDSARELHAWRSAASAGDEPRAPGRRASTRRTSTRARAWRTCAPRCRARRRLPSCSPPPSRGRGSRTCAARCTRRLCAAPRPEEAYLTNERHVQAAKDALAALESA